MPMTESCNLIIKSKGSTIAWMGIMPERKSVRAVVAVGLVTSWVVLYDDELETQIFVNYI